MWSQSAFEVTVSVKNFDEGKNSPTFVVNSININDFPYLQPHLRPLQDRRG